MRQDQLERLQDLQERLADRFLLEADPQEWPGDGKAPADMTTQERGDAYWCKKNAMATGGVLRYTIDLMSRHTPQEGDPPNTSEESDLDRKIREAERRAQDAMKRLVDKSKKTAFDKHTHGKK